MSLIFQNYRWKRKRIYFEESGTYISPLTLYSDTFQFTFRVHCVAKVTEIQTKNNLEFVSFTIYVCTLKQRRYSTLSKTECGTPLGWVTVQPNE